MFLSSVSLKKSGVVISGPQSVDLAYDLESSIKGEYSDATKRLVFDTRMFNDKDRDKKVSILIS